MNYSVLLTLALVGCAEVGPLTKEAIKTRLIDHCPVETQGNEVVIPVHIIIDVSTKE